MAFVFEQAYYEANQDLIMSMQMLFEFDMSGHISASKIDVLPIQLYHEDSNITRLKFGCSIFKIIGIVYSLFIIAIKCTYSKVMENLSSSMHLDFALVVLMGMSLGGALIADIRLEEELIFAKD